MEIEADTKTRKRESIPMTRESVSRKSTTEIRKHESDDRKKFATLKLAVESICREANQKNIVPTGEPIVRVTQFGTTDGYVCFIKYAVPQYVWNNVRWTSKSISDTLESHIRESIEHKGITIDRQPKRASAYSVHIVNVSNPSHRITTIREGMEYYDDDFLYEYYSEDKTEGTHCDNTMGISRIGRADYPCCGHCLCVTYPHCTDGETGDTCRWCMTDSDTGLSHDTKQMETSSQAIQSQSTPSQATTNVYVTRRRRFHVSDGEPKRWTPVTITRREFVDHRMYPFRALLPVLISVPMCDDLLCRKVPARMAPTDCLWKTVGEFKKLNIRLVKIGCLCGYMTEKKHYMSEQRNDFISSLLTWENGGTKQEAHGIYVIMSTTGGPLTSSALYHNIHANSETQSCRCDVLETLERFISRLPSGEHLNVYTTLDTTSTIGSPVVSDDVFEIPIPDQFSFAGMYSMRNIDHTRYREKGSDEKGFTLSKVTIPPLPLKTSDSGYLLCVTIDQEPPTYYDASTVLKEFTSETIDVTKGNVSTLDNNTVRFSFSIKRRDDVVEYIALRLLFSSAHSGVSADISCNHTDVNDKSKRELPEVEDNLLSFMEKIFSLWDVGSTRKWYCRSFTRAFEMCMSCGYHRGKVGFYRYMMEYADGWTIGVLDALIDAAVVCGDTDCEVALIRWIAYVAEAHPELVNPDHIRDYIQSNRLDSSPYDSVMALLRSEYTTAKHRKRDSGHSDIETRRTVSDKICRVLRLDMVCTLCVSWATFFMPYRSGQCITNPRKKNLLCHIDVLRCLSNRITPVEYTFRTIGFKRPSRDIFHMHSLERKSPEIQIPALDSATIANIELDTHTDITPTRIRCHTIGTKNIPIVQQQQQTLPHSDFIISEYGTQFSVPQITVDVYKRNGITLL